LIPQLYATSRCCRIVGNTEITRGSNLSFAAVVLEKRGFEQVRCSTSIPSASYRKADLNEAARMAADAYACSRSVISGGI
jgi:hypothetical protein